MGCLHPKRCDVGFHFEQNNVNYNGEFLIHQLSFFKYSTSLELKHHEFGI